MEELRKESSSPLREMNWMDLGRESGFLPPAVFFWFRAEFQANYQCFWFLAVGFICFIILSCCVVVFFFLQQTKERVKLLIQLADGFCEKGHAHAAEIKKCVTAVDKRYRDFSLRMEKYRTSLEKALGISSDSNKSVNHLVRTEQVTVLFFASPLLIEFTEVHWLSYSTE